MAKYRLNIKDNDGTWEQHLLEEKPKTIVNDSLGLITFYSKEKQIGLRLSAIALYKIDQLE